jgi:hypothetical protein
MTIRPRTAVAALALFGFLSLGCEKIQESLSGARDARPVLTTLRNTLADKRTRLSSAVMAGNMDYVPTYFNDMKTTLDSLEAQAGKMSIMDGQEMKLKVASARNIIKDAEPFVMQNDVEGVRAQQRNLDQVLFDIDGVLERALTMTDAAPTGGS